MSIQTRHLFREAARCIQAGPSLASKWRRFHYAPMSLWVRHPRQAALFVAVRPYTMLPFARMERLYALADQCNRDRIPGAFVQCGVWKGGSAAVLADLAEQGGRRLFLFDSFQGCPTPGPDDVSMHGRPGQVGEAESGLQDLTGLLRRLGLHLYRHIRICPGWFDATLATVAPEIGNIALLHLDCDWYESTKLCLEHLYPKVVTGGVVYCDDLGYWQGVRKALEEYFVRQGDRMPALNWVDYSGAWWRKP